MTSTEPERATVPEPDPVLVRELTRPLVAALAPAEDDDELFARLSEAHLARPEDRPDPATFGLPELTVLLTPVLLAAVTEVVKYILQAAAERGLRATARAIWRLLHKGAPAGPPEEELDLTAREWDQIHQIVLRVARQAGLEPGRAEQIADAVVGRGRLGQH